MRANAADLVEDEDPSNDEYSMVALMDVLQCLGVQASDASTFAAAMCRNRPRFQILREDIMRQHRVLNVSVESPPSFVELYGTGRILEAGHGCKRNLTFAGLDAFVLRTRTPDGSPPGLPEAQRSADGIQIRSRSTTSLGCGIAAVYAVLLRESGAQQG